MDELDELIAQGPTTYVGREVFGEVVVWEEDGELFRFPDESEA